MMSTLTFPKHRSISSIALPWLFTASGAVQVLDLHSTLRGVAQKGEANQLLLWAASHLGFDAAFFSFKLLAVLALLFIYVSWRRSNQGHDLAYAFTLSLLLVLGIAVVFNNYQ
jgi:hypothetical protein